jgi:uncharacterized membrane protein HdeD (DUF308 family)
MAKAKKRVVPVHKIGRNWWLPVLSGIVSVAVGIIAIAYPDITLRVLGIIFGINILLVGGIALLMAFDTNSDTTHSVMRLIVGFIAVIAGLTLLVRPGASVAAVLIVISFWLIVVGVADLLRGITIREGRWTSIVLGVIGIAAGVVLVADPDIGITTIALIAGIVFIVRGLAEVVYGFDLRRAARAM